MSLVRTILCVLAIGLTTPACQYDVTPPGAHFASEPPGAEVLIDGRRSGYVTPCLIALDRAETYRVRFVLEGYEPREFELVPGERTHTVTWTQGAIAGDGDSYAIGLGARELLRPEERNYAHSPNRLFVRLKAANLE